MTALNDPEALTQYAEAVRLKPDFAEARYNLGLSYARQGRNAEALTQFTEVVRLRPDSADAHFNLGVALAKSRQFPAAITNFQETLRLDPGNSKAKQFLEQAQGALKQSAPPSQQPSPTRAADSLESRLSCWLKSGRRLDYGCRTR